MFCRQYIRYRTLIIAVFLLSKAIAQNPLPNTNLEGMPINYVRVWAVQSPHSSPRTIVGGPLKDVKEITQYFDGIGRPLQNVSRQGSYPTNGSATDLVTPFTYDTYGREQFKNLPFASPTSDGLIKKIPFPEQQIFMQTQYGGQGESFFYAQTEFEASPFSRTHKVMAPGNSWVGNNKGVTTKYWTNTDDDAVRIWDVEDVTNDFGNYTLSDYNNGVYPAGSLYKNATEDESEKQVIEFKDKEGKVILRKVQLLDNVNGNPVKDNGAGRSYEGWLSTYYVYDDLGQLRCVIQPEAVKLLANNNWNLSDATLLKEQCFRYEYDHRGRMSMKKVPGAKEVYMVYDNRDRLVYSQDANMRIKNWWMVTLHDELNRPILTGMMTYGGSLTNLQTFAANLNFSTASPVNIQSSGRIVISAREAEKLLYQALESIEFVEGFSTINEPTAEFTAEIVSASSLATTQNVQGNPLGLATSFIALTHTRYDDYPSGNQKPYNTANISKLDPGSNPYREAPPLVQSGKTRGMVTVSKVWTMEDATDFSKGRWLETVNYYDDKGRVVQLQSDNITGGKEEVTSLYDFSGKVLCTYQSHNNPQSTAGTIRVRTSMQYDALGRLLSIQKQINDAGANKTIVLNEYDALGQLKQKTLGASLETIKYDYNIRGWLLGANRSDLAANGASPSRFAFDLGYDKQNNTSGQNYVAAQLNGNISGTIWKSAGDGIRRKYDFSYDAANRLMQSEFIQNNNGGAWDNSDINYTVQMGDGTNPLTAYDANGNIKQMQQWGWKIHGSTQIDNLTYSYFPNSNQLQAVTDLTGGENKLGDFTDKNTTATDYGYDNNGNMVSDLNKRIIGTTGLGITSGGAITYNILNLPQKIDVKNDDATTEKGTIEYVYDAAGNKLQKIVKEGNLTTTTNYISGFIYEKANSTNDDLKFFSMEEGRIRPVKDANNNITSFTYDYFIKDHLGNVRMVLTDEQKQDKYPIASLETAKVATEQNFYAINTNQIVDANPTGIPAYTNDNGLGNNPSDPGFEQANSQKLYKLNSNSAKMGLGITLKVMAGDRIDVLGKSYYNQNNTGGSAVNSAVPVLDILQGLLAGMGISASHQGITAAQLNGLPTTTQGINSLLSNETTDNNSNDQVPKAYINYLFFDEQFKCVGSGFSKVGSNGAIKDHHNDLTNLAAQKNGYVYIYCSNESPVNVFFDNLQVVHTRGAILEETHYYPFGLAMAGISSKAAAFGSPQNKDKYNAGNELQSNEFSDGSGLETYDAINRMYDPQLGRFWQVDELAEVNWEESPYSFAQNNPLLFNDPLGLSPKDSVKAPDGEMVADKGSMAEVVIVGIPKGFWAKQRLYYDVMSSLGRQGASIDQIQQDDLREMIYRFDATTKNREAVNASTREGDKIFLEAASWFVPTGWLLKMRYARLAFKLLKFKRGEKFAASIFSYITRKIANQMAKRGWTKEAIHGVVNNPYTQRKSVNLATGNTATAYFEKEGAYVIKDDITNEIFQISNKADPNWIPDKNILNPYIPKK